MCHQKKLDLGRKRGSGSQEKSLRTTIHMFGIGIGLMLGVKPFATGMCKHRAQEQKHPWPWTMKGESWRSTRSVLSWEDFKLCALKGDFVRINAGDALCKTALAPGSSNEGNYLANVCLLWRSR